MDKRIMDLFDYNECLKKVDKLLLDYERVTYKMMDKSLTHRDIKVGSDAYNNNRILNDVINKDNIEEYYNYINYKLKIIYETFCEIEKEYFMNCLLYRKITDERFSEVQNISIMHMRKIKKSVVFKITEGFNISVMKGEK